MKARITKTLISSLKPKEKPYEVHDTEMKGFLIRVQPTGVMNYYFSYRNALHKRHRTRLGRVDSMTPQNARKVAEAFYADVMKGVDVQERKIDKRKEANASKARLLKIFIEEHYEPWILTHHKYGQGTISLIKSRFKEFMNLPLESISVLKVEEWRKKRLSSNIKPTTVNRQVAALRGLLSKAVEWEIIEDHPLRKLKALRTGTTPHVRYLTPVEVTRLYAVLEERDAVLKCGRVSGNAWRKKRSYPLLPDLTPHTYADRMTPLIILSLKTGLRRGEMFALTWFDVNLDKALLTVRAENSKSGKVRHIPLSPIASDVLTSWQKQSTGTSTLVFPSKDGAKLTNVKKSWKSILIKADIEGFRWHDMRHDFASKLVMNGVPLNTVRELCGHADMNTTLRYAHLAPEHKADAVATLG